MPQLDIALNPQNDARRTIILSLPPQLETDVLSRDIVDAVRRSHEFQQRFRRILFQLYWADGCADLYAYRSGYPQVTSEDDRYHGDDIQGRRVDI